MPPPTPMDEYMFDLRGYVVLPSVLSAAELGEINSYIDGLQPVQPHGQWHGNVEVHSYYADKGGGYSAGDAASRPIDDGYNLQHIYEAGPVFESLIDHPNWIDRVRFFMGRGEPFMHELFINVRGKGGYIGVHSGGPRFDGRGWGVSAGEKGEKEWSVGYLSMIIALEDIGPGDGATVLVEGSHKSMIPHPVQRQMQTEGSLVEGAREVHLKAGDCLFFNDSLCHSAAARLNEGQRRILCFRYLPRQTGSNRWGYLPSPELMERLTPTQRQILTELDYTPTARSHVPPSRLMSRRTTAAL